MLALKYRITGLCPAVDESDGRRLIHLPVGSLMFPTTTIADSAGMVAGVCDGRTVKVFVRDLEERAERLEIRQPPATVRVMPATHR